MGHNQMNVRCYIRGVILTNEQFKPCLITLLEFLKLI